jgi:1-acyl-sn-glycerol-3-phosphate acyltransferase
VTPIYRVAWAVVRIVLRIGVRWTVVGAENLPASGPMMLASNHLSNADVVFFGASLPRQLHYMAKTELWSHPLFGLAVGAFGAFPVRRGEVDRQALRMALDLLARERVIGIFPEGHRSRDGVLQSANAGAALLAYRSGAQILPAVITGTERPIRPFRLLTRRTPVELRFGPPFRLERPGPRLTAADLDRGLAEIMGRIAALLPPERRGPWAEAVPASVTLEIGGRRM